ncbi:hypothetical protein [Ekhidna sp. To15]|uniref:hypothetical protein n=1 Tax=Ekhidna sp. To15 TaxID=3395267 RepID=UPI003F52009C
MNFISPDLDIQIVKNTDTNNDCLYFKFKGKFSQATSKAGSNAWSNYIGENPTGSFEFVWDCSDMTGFELQARKEWYNAIQRHKDQIFKVYVISDKLMIRSAAKVMLQLFGISSEISRTDEQLPKAIRR